jgi:hypothetical protein
MKKTAKVQL